MSDPVVRALALNDALKQDHLWRIYAALRATHPDLPEIPPGSQQHLAVQARVSAGHQILHPEVNALALFSVLAFVAFAPAFDLWLFFHFRVLIVGYARAAAAWTDAAIPEGIIRSVEFSIFFVALIFFTIGALGSDTDIKLIDRRTVSGRLCFYFSVWAVASLGTIELASLVGSWLPIESVVEVAWAIVLAPPCLVLGCLAALGGFLLLFFPLFLLGERINTTRSSDVLVTLIRALAISEHAEISLFRDPRAVETLSELLMRASRQLERMRLAEQTETVAEYTRRRMERVRLALEEMLVWIRFAKPDTGEHIQRRLKAFVFALASGALDTLPESDGAWQIERKSAARGAFWRRAVATFSFVVFVCFPAVLMLILKQVGVIVPQLPVDGWGVLISLAWLGLAALLFGDDMGSEVRPLIFEVLKNRLNK